MSSHTLGIEKGRHTKPKTPLEDRLCDTCRVVDDEMHFFLHCKLNEIERNTLYSKLSEKHPGFYNFDDSEKCITMMTSECSQILTWVGKFIYCSFENRKNHRQ